MLYPKRSKGELAIAIAEGENPANIEIVTADNTEYDFEPFETFSAVRIGDEVYKYTGITVITDGVRLTGCTTTLDGGYSTITEDHDVGDEVQKCIWYRDMRAVTIVKHILELALRCRRTSCRTIAPGSRSTIGGCPHCA